jgi:HK97 family phage major capsid protein
MALIDRSGASVLIPQEYANEILAEVPQGSTIMRLARRLPDLGAAVRNIPVMSALPTAYFVAEVSGTVNDETTRKPTTNAEWENVVLTVGELACIVPIPESVVEDSSFDIWATIKPYIVEAIGVKFDEAVLYYTAGQIAGWPAGIVEGAPATHKVAINAGSGDLYDNVMGENGIISVLEADGYLPNAHVAHLSLRGKMRGLRDTTKQPILQRNPLDASRYQFDGINIEFPTTGVIDPAKSLDIAGDWTKLV